MSVTEARPANYDRIVGAEGWQFISRIDGIDEKNAAAIRLSEAELVHWARTLEFRAAWCARRGAAYHFMVAPNKASVYGEFLPPGLAPSPDRDLCALTRHLAANSDAVLLDPRPALLDEKPKRDVYFRGDEHWNSIGAFIAYTQLMREVTKTVAAPILAEAELKATEKPFMGGLEALAESPEPERIKGLAIKQARSKEIFVNKRDGRGKVQVFAHEDASLPRAVVLRDSFGSFMLPFLIESFSRVVVVSSRAVLLDLVRSEKPDVVIHELCERYLDAVPDDIRAKPFRTMCDIDAADLPARAG
ncbi:MAG: hypothetical protein JOZ72_18890 [Alphaproteobacteria bacterium]|nr:hypothetical protein [Alphaproteobacteria bacterium]